MLKFAHGNGSCFKSLLLGHVMLGLEIVQAAETYLPKSQ